MNMKRRTFVKGALSTSAVAIAAGAGLLAPQAVLAAYPKANFEAKDVNGAVGSFEHSDDIKIKAPDIAENGAVVPVTVSTTIEGAESISVVIAKNGTPLAAKFMMGAGTHANFGCRVKMGKTSDVIGVVNAGGKMYANKKEVKVTIGGCGG